MALITDNAPNMKASWKLLGKEYPWMIFEGCKAHGIDLAAKDLCKLEFISEVTNECVKIAKFFR
jgi:hypothetical protein